MIEGIRLRNWKTHSDSSFEFGRGTNVLVGKMGSGKSSVMDAICFALFGTFPGLQGRKVSIEEVIASKPERADEATVELEFSYNGSSYRAERTIKRKGSTEAKLYREGKAIAGPKPRDVNQAIEKAIEINYNLFSRAVYSEQNEIDSFLRLSPRDRKAKFDELLDLQKYEKARANAVTALNRLKGIARDKAAWVAEQKKEISGEEESELKKRVEEKENENKRLRETIEGKRKAVEEREREIKALEEKERQFKELKEGLSKNRAVSEELRKAVSEAKKEAGERTLEQIEKEKRELDESIQKLEEKLSETKKLEERERIKKESSGKRAASNEKRVEELNKHLKELQRLEGQCPLCRQKLETKTREELLLETGEEARKAGLEMQASKKEEEESRKKLRELQETGEKALKEKEKAKERKTKAQQLHEALSKTAEKENRLQHLEKERKEIEGKLEKTGFREEELNLKRKQAIEEKAAIEAAKKGIEANTQLAKQIRQSLQKIENTKKQIRGLEERIATIQSGSEKLSYFINSLLASQTELRETLTETINRAMDDIWKKVYPYQDLVSAKMDVVEGSYELKAKERNGNWVRVEGILSGGERSAAAICIRIAFSLVLARNLSWLILDEPTHNLDTTAVETLAQIMQKHLPELVEQIFIITHDPEMKKAATSSLYVLEREKDKDSATRPVPQPI